MHPTNANMVFGCKQDLEGWHAGKHGIRPQRIIAIFLKKLYRLLCHTPGAQHIVLVHYHSLEHRETVNHRDHQEQSHGNKMWKYRLEIDLLH